MEKETYKVSVLSKRISAYLIDILFVFIVIGLISEIKIINPNYDKYIETYENYSEILNSYTNDEITEKEFNELYNENYYLVSKYSVSYNIIIILVIVLYFAVFQKYNNGQTLGKKFMKIRITSSTNEKVGLFSYIVRILPMYYIYIGGVIPLIINSILVYCLNENIFINITTIISYLFLLVSIISFVFICVRKDERGIHDILANTKVEYIGNKNYIE